jgi:hypothetical protein
MTDELVPTVRAGATLLAWGIKPSFLRYVAGVGGEIACEDGAAQAPDGFVFPVADEAADATLSATGSVRIRAHGGLLDVALHDLRLTPTADGEQLSVAAGAGRRILATAPRTPADATGTAPLLLHADAVVLFDGTYPPGTELDPIRFLRPAGTPAA